MTIDINNNSTIHYGSSYDRIEHVQRQEPLFANPSVLWRLKDCPAAGRKICYASQLKPDAVAGLTVDRIVAESMLQRIPPRVLYPDEPERILKQAEDYRAWLYRILEKTGQIRGGFEVHLRGTWIPGFQGVADCILYDPERSLIIIIDHKTGRSQAYTSAGLQLRSYAVMISRIYPVEHIRLVLLQPDADSPLQVTKATPADVASWDREIAAVIAYAMEHPNEFHPGCYTCLKCPHRHSCEALRAFDEKSGGAFTTYQKRISERYKTA